MKTLLLIDAPSLMFRAYYALPPMHGPDGAPTNCLYGVHRMLARLLDDLSPTHGAACLDLPEPTFRHEAFADYKANRAEAPGDFVRQIEPSKELFQAYGLRLVEAAGFEADDVIATLAGRAKEEAEVLILSPDRDFIQLVTQRVHLLLPEKGVSQLRRLGPADVQRAYGILPSQWVDYKMLVGDASDNVPGVPGVGPKTAARLLCQYGTLEETFARLSELPDKLRPALRELAGREERFRRLMLLRADAPLEVSLEALALKGPTGRLPEFLSRFGIRTVAEDTKLRPPKPAPAQSSLF